jgi:lipoprotein-releasing system permease protein
MKVEYFIAKRLLSRKNVSTSEGGKGIRPIILIAIAGIALGIMVMLVSVAIVTGFQTEIRAKVVGFGSHLTVTAFNPLVTDYSRPIDRNQNFVEPLSQNESVKNIQVFANKEGILKTENDLHGIVVKGVDQDFDWSFFSKSIIEGKALKIKDGNPSDSILISKKIADKLRLSLHDKVLIYFIQNEKARPRRLYIGGIYNTGLEKFDETHVIADIKHIQKINDWSPNLVSGFEVVLKEYEDLDKLDDFIYNYIDHNLTTIKITDLNRDIFSWLELQDINVIIIILLIILVSAINMSSALLIMILEKTGFIGILKSMGASSWTIRKVFLLNASYLIGVGLFWGNIFGIGFCVIQKYFHILKLPQDSYYIPYVPINLEWGYFLALNIGTLTLCTLALIIPSVVVGSISPVKAIKFR